MKWKAEQTGLFVIGGYVPGAGGFDELIVGYREPRRGLRFCGRVRAAFVPRTRELIKNLIVGTVVKDCPFWNLPEEKGARWGNSLTAEEMRKCKWVQPAYSIRVSFVEWTEGKHLRHSRFVDVG